MDFIPNREQEVAAMLQVIGVSSIEELFSAIPSSLIQSKPQHDDGLSECEALWHMQNLAAKNTFTDYDNYLGAGAYEHYVPAIVSAICSKSEFLSSYTPYQAEASQGMLQSIFEYQSAICALTGMDVANASLYDGASACAEAALMAMRLQNENGKLLIASTLNPFYRGVVDQYLSTHDQEIETIASSADGRIDLQALKEALKQPCIGILMQSPNFFGIIEDVQEIRNLLNSHKCLLLLAANPLSYGLYSSAGELGVDIAIGDTQPFGLSTSFGGPYAGYIACKNELVRQLPGRIVGETVDTCGKRGFVLTLQAREQHIRREKATSNICTNQALAALATLVAISWYGKNGVKALALTNARRTHYLQQALSEIPGIKLLTRTPVFNEFAVSFSRPVAEVQSHFRKYAIEPGYSLGCKYPHLQDYILVAVTEMKTKEQLDKYINTAKGLLQT